MVGCNNSVWSRLHDIAPNYVLIKCICYSLALCVQHAFNTLPSHLGFFLLSEMPSWFKSALRRDAFKTLFSIMHPNNERQGAPSPFLKMCTTRWLVRGKVNNSMLLNWEELKAYFCCAEQTGGADVRYKARMISSMLADNVNYLLSFPGSCCCRIWSCQSTFQATQADPHHLMTELSTQYHFLSMQQSVW